MKSNYIPNSFVQFRRIFRLNESDNEGENEDQIDISVFEKFFSELLINFPSADLATLSEQLTNMITFFQNDLSKFSGRIDFIHSLNFPTIFLQLFLNDTINEANQIQLLNILQLLTYEKYYPEKLNFIETSEFLGRLCFFLTVPNDQFNKSALHCVINIIRYYPNSHEFLPKTNIFLIITTHLINSKDMVIVSEASSFLFMSIPFITDIDSKNMLIQATATVLARETSERPLTYLLKTVLLCMSEDENIRLSLVDQNICRKCNEVLQNMKKINKYTQFYGDYALQILALIANVGTEAEIAVLIDSGVFHTYFEFVYSFLDIEPNIHVDNDSFEYVCSFLSGLILRANETANELIEKYSIFPQICFILINGNLEKKKSSLCVIASAVEVCNVSICQLIMQPEMLESLFELMTAMSPNLIHLAIHILAKLMEYSPQAKENFLNHDILYILESIVNNEDDDPEKLNEVEAFMQYINNRE